MSNDVVFIAPEPVVSAGDILHTGVVAFVAPAPSVDAVGTNLWGVAYLTHPTPEVSATGTMGNIGDASLSGPAPSVSATGLNGIVGSVSFTSPRPIVEASSNIILGQASVESPAPIVLSSGFIGRIGVVDFEPPSPSVLAGGYFLPAGTVSFTAPTPIVSSDGYSAALSPSFRGLAINLSHYGSSEYTGWPFNSFATLDGKLLSAGPGGICLIGGERDNGVFIKSRIRSGVFDLWLPKRRKIIDVWMTYRALNEMVLQLIPDEGEPWEGIFSRIDEQIHECRVKAPRGFKNRFFEIEIRNRGGCDFDLESVRVMVDELSRLR